MYSKFYGFREKPFSLTPDPDFFYFSKDHLAALENICFGISEGEGFMLLAGAVGAGKTTLSRKIFEKLEDRVVVAMVLNPFQTFYEILKNILWDFGVIPDNLGEHGLTEQLREFLLNEIGPKGKTALIIIDEAQNLSKEVLENLRLLSNIETDKEKLMQILFLGQEELIDKLKEPELRQLNQRISIRYFLAPLEKKEVRQYLMHRVRKSLPSSDILFTEGAVRKIYKFSGGVPRLINMVANRCLVAGYVAETNKIDSKIVSRAVLSLYGENKKNYKRMRIRSLFKRKRDEDYFTGEF